MFSNLSDFGMKRSAKEAFGFYIAYFFMCVLLGGLLAGFFSAATGNRDNSINVRIGQITAVVFCLSISCLIAVRKKDKSFKAIIMIILAGVLSLFSGALGGLIPAAYLSSADKNE